MSNVRIFPTDGTDPNALLQAATNSNLKDVVIIGWDDEGALFVSSNLPPQGPALMGLIEIAKNALLNIYDDK